MSQLTLRTFRNSGSECPECGRTFKNTHGMKIHYESQHSGSVAGVEVLCDNCGDITRKHESRLSPPNYCCRSCRDDHSAWNAEGEDSYLWNGGTEWLECDWCDGEFEEHESSRTGDKTFCSSECYAEYQRTITGPENPLWEGGADLRPVLATLDTDVSWQTTRNRAIERDGSECALCGCGPDAEELHVHHIIPLLAGGTSAEELLMTLCRSCHRTVESYTNDIPEIKRVVEVD
jgi:5-methylcytosine-specific restriction endonuclease McrA